MVLEEEMAKLVLRTPPGTEYIIERTPFLIGRKSNAGLFIPDASVSREHALIEKTEGRYTIRDIGSTNGTFLNHRMIGREPVELHEDDVIMINRRHEYSFVTLGKTEPVINPLYVYGLDIDESSYQIYVDGIPISPDKRGYRLICLLAENPGKVCTYEEIAERLYPDDRDPDSRIQRIRSAKNDLSKRLKQYGISRKLIRSRSGIGYQLCDE